MKPIIAFIRPRADGGKLASALEPYGAYAHGGVCKDLGRGVASRGPAPAEAGTRRKVLTLAPTRGNRAPQLLLEGTRTTDPDPPPPQHYTLLTCRLCTQIHLPAKIQLKQLVPLPAASAQELTGSPSITFNEESKSGGDENLQGPGPGLCREAKPEDSRVSVCRPGVKSRCPSH
ncbi:hypothetical protein INR49_016219 [Caranx melampygus]|nr:hypothetical protein INR49_016219 [Caranx melampygus]